MVRCLLNVELENTSAFFCMTTYFELRATHQQLARHDDLREETLSRMFVRPIASFGSNGMEVLFNVTDGGKTNTNNNLVC